MASLEDHGRMGKHVTPLGMAVGPAAFVVQVDGAGSTETHRSLLVAWRLVTILVLDI